MGNVKDSVFVFTGFSNWKDTIITFGSHEKSATHKRAVEGVITLPQRTRDVATCFHQLMLQRNVKTNSASLPSLKAYVF